MKQNVIDDYNLLSGQQKAAILMMSLDEDKSAQIFALMDDEEIKYPALTELAGDIFVFPQLIGKIDSILDKFGKVKDSASSTLSQIRREITITMSGISRSLQSILRAAQSDGVVDKDVTPTMRDGRLMIPARRSL